MSNDRLFRDPRNASRGNQAEKPRTPGKRTLTESLPARPALEQVAGGGELPHREQLERAFGEDLSGVSASVAQGAVLGPMGVRGVALGEKLAFADAAPEMRLVAHEVTHALQKRHAGGMGLGLKTFSEGHVDDAEREANDLGSRAAAGERARVSGAPSAAIQLARHDDVPRKHVRITATGEEGEIVGVLQDDQDDADVQYQFQPLNGAQAKVVLGGELDADDSWKTAAQPPAYTMAKANVTASQFSGGGGTQYDLDADRKVDILEVGNPKLRVMQGQATGYVNRSDLTYIYAHTARQGPLYDPQTGPAVDDVEQGTLDDCYLLAPLLAVVRTNPNHIKEMLLDSGTKVTVLFYDRVPNTQPVQFQRQQVTVDKSLLMRNQRPRFAHGPHDWPAIIEKAWTTFKLQRLYTKVPENRSADIAFEAITGRESTGEAMLQVLPGVSNGQARNPLADEMSLTMFLHQHLNGPQPQMMTIGTDDNLVNPPLGIVSRHWYELVSIDQQDNIRLRNPHGTTVVHGPAEVVLTPAQVIANFKTFSRVDA